MIDLQVLYYAYKKYLYYDEQSIKTDWSKALAYYKEKTGREIRYETARKKITSDVRIMLYEEKFNKVSKQEYIEEKKKEQKPFSYRLLIDVRNEENVRPIDVLRLANLDPLEWTVEDFKITNSEIATREGMKENYYATVRVKPEPFPITRESLFLILEEIPFEPINVSQKEFNDPYGLLEIPLFDMHFPLNTFEDYKVHHEKIARYILSQEWEEILFVIGQDLFHNDNFEGTTSHGTIIEKVSLEDGWEQASRFYIPLIMLALENSQKVKVIYSKGNHDRTLGFAFCKMLEAVFIENSHIEFDITDNMVQAHKYKNVLLGYSHGHKLKDKDIAKMFVRRFIAQIDENTRLIFKKGHKHTMGAFDDFGITTFSLGTSAKTDKWHDDMGFIGNHKAFEIFIYDDYDLIGHLFINDRKNRLINAQKKD